MAITTCTKCKKTIDERLSTCPECGNPMQSTSVSNKTPVSTSSITDANNRQKVKPTISDTSKGINSSKKKKTKTSWWVQFLIAGAILSAFKQFNDGESQRKQRLIQPNRPSVQRQKTLDPTRQQPATRVVLPSPGNPKPASPPMDPTKIPSSGAPTADAKTSLVSKAPGNVSKVDPKSIHLDIPILVTSSTENGVIGNVQKLPLTYRREPNSEAPLQIAIFEDRPSGAGQTLRSSVWLAAIVAALQRSDDMAGVRLTLDVSGAVDGPSAGGMICLSLLSLLDGRTMPKDFAFTGSILPDGTIGRVGHVAHKMKAASRQGMKKVLIPSYLRFQADQNTGELVDLKSLAKSLGMKYLPVDNIEQAFHVIYGEKLEPSSNLQSRIDQLEKPMEELFIRRTKELVAAGDQVFQQLTEKEQDALRQNLDAQLLFVSRENAIQSLQAGRFCYSYSEAFGYKQFLLGFRTGKKLSTEFRSNETTSTEEFLARIIQETKKTLDEVSEPWQVAINLSSKVPSIASQFCTQLELLVITRAMVEQLDLQMAQDLRDIDALDTGTAGPDQTKAQRKSQLIEDYKFMQLILAKVTYGQSEEIINEINSSAQVVPVRPLAKNAANRVEKFFYTAYATAHQTLQSDVINRLAKQERVTNESLTETLMSLDEAFLEYSSTAPISDEFHKKIVALRPKDDHVEFLEALNAQLCALRLADASGVIMAWNELDGEFDEDGVRIYEHTAFLSYLLRSARANAIESIAKCRAASIPCPEAIYYFQLAESTRDDRVSDLVDVLVSYWKASLEAQALKMLFHPNAKVSQ